MADVYNTYCRTVLDQEKRFRIDTFNVCEYISKIGKFLRQGLEESGRDFYVLGISGGLDSAVAAALAKREGLPLYGLMLPYGDTMKESGSYNRSMELIESLGMENDYAIVDIMPYCAIADANRAMLMKKFPCDHVNTPQNLRLASENRRARQRMAELFDFAQTHRALVLGTDNLDEHCLGYFTKYGDGASDREPLQYCLKGEVRLIAEALNVPTSIRVCAPSAELSADQTDEKDLGFSYDDFDKFALNGTSNDEEIDKLIRARWEMTQHKRAFPPAFND